MQIKKVSYSKTFIKDLKKVPTHVQKIAAQKEKLFKSDPQLAILRTHKLQGQLNEFYAFSVNYEYRILFIFEDDGSATFIDIGTHSIYK